MPLNAFMKFSNANGESRQKPYDRWVEIQGWEWGVKAETSWKQGGGASVGKPDPQDLSFEHYYDSASPAIMASICLGKSFDEVKLEMCKSTGRIDVNSGRTQEAYFLMTMKDCFITSVVNTADNDGNVVQKVDMVFKEVEIDYRPQLDGKQGGAMGAKINYKWNIPAGTASGG